MRKSKSYAVVCATGVQIARGELESMTCGSVCRFHLLPGVELVELLRHEGHRRGFSESQGLISSRAHLETSTRRPHLGLSHSKTQTFCAFIITSQILTQSFAF